MRNNHKMPNKKIPENVAFRVSKGKGTRVSLWEKLYDITQYLDVPVNVALEHIIIDWYTQNITKGNDHD